MKRISHSLFFILLIVSLASRAQWQYAGAPGRINCFAAKGDTLFAGTNAGVYVSADYGLNWTLISNGLDNREVNCLLTANNSLYAGTSDGIFVMAKNVNGLYWNQWYAQQLACTNVTQLFVFDGYIYAYAEKISTIQGQSCAALMKWVTGNGWQTLSNKQLKCIAEYDGRLIASIGFTVCSSADKGVTWSQLSTLPTGLGLLSVNGSSIYVSSFNGLYLSVDGGIQWTPVRNGYTYVSQINNQEYYSFPVCLVFDSQRFYAGSAGFDAASDGWGAGIYLSINNGANWERANSGFTTGPAGLFPPHITSLIIHGQFLFAGLFNGGGVWRRHLSELTSTEDLVQSAPHYQLAPNPAYEAFDIFLSEPHSAGNAIEVMIFDSFGRQVAIAKEAVTNSRITVDIAGLDPGLYSVRVYSDRHLLNVQKVVKLER